MELGETLEGIDPKLKVVLLGWAMRHPSRYLAYGRMLAGYRKARCARLTALAEGVRVPPFMILSITSRCNLQCAGCYAASAGITGGGDGLGIEDWRRIVAESCDLGVFGFILTGGEPFMFPGLLELVSDFRERLFIIVTNGTALREEDFARLERLPNAMVVVSIEGGEEITDARRGAGVHKRAMDTLRRLGGLDIPTGISVTVNRLNCGYWMVEENIDSMVGLGVRLGIFIEQIPPSPSPENSCASAISGAKCPSIELLRKQNARDDGSLMLDKQEQKLFRAKILNYRANKTLYLVHAPGDEELFGGCVSAGRGFAHVTPRGDMTPCPMSNIATHNLTESPVRKALASPLFDKIRDCEGLLGVKDTPCALAARPDEVEELARKVGAYRTDGKARTGSKRSMQAEAPW